MKNLVKIISIVLVLVLVVNIILLALGLIPDLLFWFIIILAAISSFVIKKLKL